MALPAIQIGELRHRVSIQTLVQSASSTAAINRAWSTDATVWAKVEAIAEGQRVTDVQRGEGATHRFTIRHRTMSAEKWLLFDDRRFKVLAWRDPDERGVYLEITAEEVRET